MKSYMVIEPTRFNRIHMNYLSPAYKFYHHQLKDAGSDTIAAERTREFCLTHEQRELEDQLAMMEFLYMNDYFEDLEKALEFEHIHSDVKKLYKIVLERKKVPLTAEDLKEMETFQFEHPSLKCIHLFLLVYGYYDMKRYAGMDKYTEEIQQALFTINEPLFHYFMKLRFDELTFHHYFKTNSLLLARKFAYKYISSGLAPKKQATMHSHLALTYAFEDYDTSLDYLYQTKQIADEHDLKMIARSVTHHSIPFISAFHRRTENVETSDPVEIAHLSIARGRPEDAIKILEGRKTLSPFQQSYLGLAKKDLALLREAKERFIHEQGDQFFAQLPEHYMKRILTIV
ncbi:AimR family lysis-lysogeny pheromone receptor [Halobacillus litoralis]|uniref:AimR family lysis-lysogeny pheromone receptor n=1 Tax=Halobacillus litoralis TaxID=45668 RepID=UPI001CD35045|nr:AimR family lysis-lysogeny pheromone receptor [Halobacillus litoralis]MCA0972529.1 AimR family lysis-lysogeny pheromone receptor [Halobacillus litoralis]